MPSLRPTISTLCTLFLLGSGACVETTGLGPDLGACADPGDQAYGYGEVGIGTCLAGPVDLVFIEQDGASWLAVSNADPFRNFDGGSVLLLDWSDIISKIDQGAGRELMVDQINSRVLPFPEPEHFVGGLGWIEDRDLLIATRRFTKDGRTREGRDSAFVFDLTTDALFDHTQVLQLEDDPGDVVVAADGTVFVLNYTDHSISVFNAQTATDAGPILPIDLAPEASLVAGPLNDADGSGSIAELERIAVLDPSLLTDDEWTAEYLPGQFRVWIPGPDSTLDRWTTGGLDWVRTAIGAPLDLGFLSTEPRDFVASFQTVQTTEADQVLELLYADQGTIYTAANTGVGAVDEWQISPAPLLQGRQNAWDQVVGGPSRAVANTGDTLYYDGSTGDPGADHHIGAALLDSSGDFLPLADPILSAPAGLSYEQPFVQIDSNTNTARMWLSIFDGTRYVIGHTQADDGFSFAEPEVVLDLPGVSIAAPVVRHQDGRYHLWASVWDGVSWEHVTATSADGIDWSSPQPLTISETIAGLREPPRVGVHGDPSSIWRVTGADEGLAGARLTPGLRFIDITRGYAIGVSGGQEIHRSDLFPLGRASAGVVPTSQLTFVGRTRVFVTIEDDDGRTRIASIDRDDDGNWDVVNPDIIGRNDGGNLRGVSSPLVFERQGRYAMLYSARGTDNRTRVRWAVSDDGRLFTPVGEALFDPEIYGTWLGAEQEAHSIEFADDGTIRVFLSGNDGSRWRIGAVATGTLDLSAPEGTTWRLDPGRFNADVQLAPGLPGGADDSGVKDPAVVSGLDGRFMYYSAFDGNRWHIARAEWDGNDWVRRTDATTETTLPAMTGTPRSFSAGGVFSPVVRRLPGGIADVWYAGTDRPSEDNDVVQLGYALGRGPHLFPHLRMPTAGDTLSYRTERGDEGISVIELSQNVRSFFTTGTGTTSLVLDEERGFLYVPSKLSDLLYVIDIRDDSREGFADKNVFDIETVVSFPTVSSNAGFRGGVVIPGQDRVVFSTRSPDGLAFLDLSQVEDNAEKEITRLAFVATLPLQDSSKDVGAESVVRIGGAQPALLGELLFVPHFRDNSLSVFDLSLGPNGEEVAYIPNLGENPHLVAISPDQRFAVVANYAGDVVNGLSSGSLALVDIDPTSPGYLTPTHWIRNKTLQALREKP